MKQSQSLKYRADVLEYDSLSWCLFRPIEMEREEGICPKHAPGEEG